MSSFYLKIMVFFFLPQVYCSSLRGEIKHILLLLSLVLLLLLLLKLTEVQNANLTKANMYP